jgi:hypothetical protein
MGAAKQMSAACKIRGENDAPETSRTCRMLWFTARPEWSKETTRERSAGGATRVDHRPTGP